VKPGKPVMFNDGATTTMALVAKVHGPQTVDLITFDAATGASSRLTSVPRRDPSDYAKGGGGGRTWHPIS